MSNTNRSTYASRTGPRDTVYEVRKDPILQNVNVLHADEKIRFPYVSGSTYKGQWKNNLKEGFGVEKSADGTKYEGDWKKGKRHGRGTIWVKRDKKSIKRYAGEWVDNRMEGFGFYYYDNGDVYRRNWLDNKRCGHGQLESANGDLFEGEWFDDMRQGPGTLYLENGNVYDGHWLRSMKEGPGRFFYASTRKVSLRGEMLSQINYFLAGIRRGVGSRLSSLWGVP